MVSSFGDLGQPARDLFDEHFNFGFLNLEFKTKSENDTSLTYVGKHAFNTDRINLSFESKFDVIKDLAFKTKVDSKLFLTNELEFNKFLHKNVSHNLVTTVDPESGVPHYPTISLGGQLVVDTQQTTLTKQIYAANFKNDNLQVFGSLTDNSDVNVSVFQGFENMKLGFRVGWRNDTKNTNFGAAFSYKPNVTSKVVAKVDHNCVVGLAYKLKLNPNATMTLCTQMEGKNIESGAHKFGIGFKFN